MSSGHKAPKDKGEKASPADIKEAMDTLPPDKLAAILADAQAVDQQTPGAQELGKVGDYKARAMDFASLRLHHDVPETEGLVDGANFMVTPKVVPKDHLYVDSALDPSRRPSVLSHEGVETTLMQQHKWDYTKAHKIGNHFEQEALKATQQPQQPTIPGMPPPSGAAQAQGIAPPMMPQMGPPQQ